MHNINLRRELGYTEELLTGDLLTGYNNLGWPTLMIENGTDYSVAVINYTDSFHISTFYNLVGKTVDLVDIDENTNISRNLFFIDIQHTHNVSFMNELVRRAEKVNQRYSTKDEYKKYCALKNKAVFLENVYRYEGRVMTESTFKDLHPLLFLKVSDVIDTQTKRIPITKLSQKLESEYGELAEARLCDNKPFADAETFADQYMVVEKDIYYGYAITAHKSQGSTYDCAYVDDSDFDRIVDRWNYRLRALETRQKEKNQLKYVAYTRASKKLNIII
jgi:hypothetical protein